VARRYGFGLPITLHELQWFYNLELEYASTDELRSMALHGHSALADYGELFDETVREYQIDHAKAPPDQQIEYANSFERKPGIRIN
jgi:hypothetical protein